MSPAQRYTKKFKKEWAFFLNEHGKLGFAEKCKLCERDCKQSFRAVLPTLLIQGQKEEGGKVRNESGRRCSRTSRKTIT